MFSLLCLLVFCFVAASTFLWICKRRREVKLVVKTVVSASIDPQIITRTNAFASLEAQVIAKAAVFASLDPRTLSNKNKLHLYPLALKGCKNNGICIPRPSNHDKRICVCIPRGYNHCKTEVLSKY